MAQRGHRGVQAMDSLDHAIAHLRDHVTAGDVVVTLGAGNVNRVVHELAGGQG
jgi:UDP-N-acetylmuramate-alanine ligase